MSSPSSSAVVKKTVYICEDFLYDIFPNVGNVRLGLDVAVVSGNYDAMINKYFKTKKRKLGRRLWIRKQKETDASKKAKKNVYKSELVANNKVVPFADIPPPKEILGFKSISISFVDANAMAFLEKFRPLFDKGIAFKCGAIDNDHEKEFRQIWPLFRDNIVKMALFDPFLVHLRLFFGPTVLRDCAQLRFVNSNDIHLEGVPDDAARTTTAKALLKWLYTAREDGHPKVLTTDEEPIDDQINCFKEEFRQATTAVSFIVRFRAWSVFGRGKEVEEFELSNERTGEKLTLRCVEDNDRKDLIAAKQFGTVKFEIWVLERGPIKREEKLWTEWAKEGPFNTDYWEESNAVYVNLVYNRQLGPVEPIMIDGCVFRRPAP